MKKKILITIIGISIIVAGLGLGLAINNNNNNNNCDSGPRLGIYATSGLEIKNEVVLNNGTVKLTVYCYYIYYCDPIIPEYELFEIEYAFINLEKAKDMTESHLIDFNISLGDLQFISNITDSSGNIGMPAYEEIEITFQTDFSLVEGMEIYVGVIDTYGARWDIKTVVISS